MKLMDMDICQHNDMKASEILYRAAEVVQEDYHGITGCCEAIEKSVEHLFLKQWTECHRRAQKYLESIYEKDGYKATGRSGYWMGNLGEENKELRIMALLFTATIAESIGD